MKTISWAVILYSIAILSGCATNATNMSSADVSKNIRVSDSKYDSSKIYDGPPIQGDAGLGLLAAGFTKSWLRTAKDKKNGTSIYGVYIVADYFGSWRYYKSASFEGGKTLKLISIDRKVNHCRAGCNYTEQMLLTLSRDYLEQKKNTGFTFRINGEKISRNQGSEITIPASYIQGYLAGIK